MRALISVSDKTEVVTLASEISQLGFEIISTGETAKTLRQAKILAKEVSEFTNFPEILKGRVKTLHPKIFGGILYSRDNPSHKIDIEQHEISSIDWVVVNLYPFEKIDLEDKIPKSEMLEFIDIGGVSLLRAAAKNFAHVVVLCDQKDYSSVVQELKENKVVSVETRKKLAAKAFAHTAHYDSIIAKFFREDIVADLSHLKNRGSSGSSRRVFSIGGTKINVDQSTFFPSELTIGLHKINDLRYGENPHQRASLYRESGDRDWGVVNAEKLQGKELSFNNYLDLDSAWQIINSFNLGSPSSQPSRAGYERNDQVCCAIIKHTNPCGTAIKKSALESFQFAFKADSLSAFGGVIGFSSTVDEETAGEITKNFFESVIAPDFTPSALEVFKKKPNLRVLRQRTTLTFPYEFDTKKISGGILVQERDIGTVFDLQKSIDTLQNPTSHVVTRRTPTPEELLSLEFAWKISKFVKSNAVVLVRGTVTDGIGAGQTSRIDSLKIAIQKAGLQGIDSGHPILDKGQYFSKIQNPELNLQQKTPLVMASDGFFPFRDCVDESAKVGISAIIQPGGSTRDRESIEAADENHIAMIFTGVRHFRH